MPLPQFRLRRRKWFVHQHFQYSTKIFFEVYDSGIFLVRWSRIKMLMIIITIALSFKIYKKRDNITKSKTSVILHSTVILLNDRKTDFQ